MTTSPTHSAAVLLSLLLLISQSPARQTAKAAGVPQTAPSSTPEATRAAGLIFILQRDSLELGEKFADSEDVFVSVREGGKTQAMRFGQYNPTVIGVYRGRLPGTDAARLIARSRSILPEADALSRPVMGQCHSDIIRVFFVRPHGEIGAEASPFVICLRAVPGHVRELVEEFRELWRRLRPVRPAFAYLRAEPVDKQHVGGSPSTPLRGMPGKLRRLISDVIRDRLSLGDLSRPLYLQLKGLVKGDYFYVVDKGSYYSITVSASRVEAAPGRAPDNLLNRSRLTSLFIPKS